MQSRHLGLRPSQRYKTKVATELCGWARARNIPISTFLKLWFKDLYPSLICSSRYLLFHSFRGVFNTRTQNVLEIRFAPKLCYRHDVDERGEFDFCMHSFCNQLEKIVFILCDILLLVEIVLFQDCTLSEILDEDDVLQETKSQNRKLVDL